MNIIDSIILFYGHLGRGSYLLTPLRIAVRHVAEMVIPRMLDKERLKEKPQSRRIYKDKSIIVSFTSFPARIKNVHLVVKCIKRQSINVDKIVLWLSKEQFRDIPLPETLTSLVDESFEIRMVEGDYRSHKKYCYAFKEFRDDIIVLIDDDIYYPSTMIEKLLEGLKLHPEAVICQFGSEMSYNADGTLPPYNKWWKEKTKTVYSKDFFFGTGGGSLFRPKMIINKILDTELAIELTPLADDIWVNAMVRMSGLPIYKIKCGLLLQISNQQGEALKKQNAYEGKNDEQFKNIIEFFLKEYRVNPFAKIEE